MIKFSIVFPLHEVEKAYDSSKQANGGKGLDRVFGTNH
jgi:hypothetical protein